MPAQQRRFLIHYGEIGLKGRNRPQFQKALQRNIRHRLARLGLEWDVERLHDRMVVHVPPGNGQADAGGRAQASAALARVAGIVWFADAQWLPASAVRDADGAARYGALERCMIELAAPRHRAAAAFAVRVRRADKHFPARSDEVERVLGAAIIRETDWREVNLGDPDETFHADIHPEGIYVYAERSEGVGGLPVGTSGKVLTLLSGGIDSPVAAFLMAKRGCRVDFIHFTAALVQQQRAEEYKVARLARDLSRYTQRSRLHLVPYIHFDLALARGETRYELILFRRFMARVAEVLAARSGAQALVTGDSLGQVASQTLENIVSKSRAVEMPVLRPLIAYDKQEIVALARRIGTFAISVEPYKDCCAILSQNPKTLSEHTALCALEAQLLPGYGELIERTLADAVTLDYDCGDRVSA